MGRELRRSESRIWVGDGPSAGWRHPGAAGSSAGGESAADADPTETIEPASDQPIDPGIDQAIDAILQRRASAPSELIELLHAIQPLQGHLSRRSLHRVACALRLPLSHVIGVASFYHLFRLSPPPVHRLAVCSGTACFVNGAPQLRTLLAARLSAAIAIGGWELHSTGCLAACGHWPVLRIDDAAPLPVRLQPLEPLLALLSAHGVPQADDAGALAPERSDGRRAPR
jgi:NADH:ubiquinone oxidoreductase subunit E